MKRRNIIMVMMTSLLLGSCSSEDILSVPNGNGRIRFDVGVSQSQEVVVTPMNGGATRSAEPLFLPTSSIEMHSGDMTMYANFASTADIPMHNIIPETTTRGSIQTADNFYSAFGLFGYFYDSTQSWDLNSSYISPESSMKNLEVTQTSKSWTTNVYWPGGTKEATFFAYAPYNSNVALTSNTGAPKITYTVPSVIANQQDLLIAKSTADISCDGKTTVALDFKHALSAIKFVKGDTPGYKEIKAIQISGINNQGTLNMNSQSWENTSGSATYSISTIDENTVCFLMPQSVPSGAKLSVTLTNGGTEHTFEADLKTTTWQAGHQYTYQLSTNKVTGTFKFEVTPSSSFVAITGGKATFTVRSYFQYQDNTIADIPWSGSYTIGETTKTVTGVGGDTGEEINIDIDKNESIIDHTETLRANQSKGTAQNPWNLSNSQGKAEVENTANCYVVNSKGTYSIPLVYGCAIKNGNTNSLAYGAGTYNSTTLNTSTFKTHNDERISDPYIYNNPSSGTKYNPSYAELLWQDWQGLISSVTYNSNTKMIEFEIGEGIHQGNAIIAIKDADNVVLWSWHIWVTDRNIYATVPIQTVAVSGTTQHTYNFMPVPLGWVDLSEGGVSSRTFTVTLIQPQSNKTLTATANQAGQSASSGTCPYYQWGRKDPFCPSDGTTSNTDKTLYNLSGNSFTMTKTPGKVSTGTSIQNPTTYYYSSDSWDWNSTTYYDYWNATNGTTTSMNDNTVVKTVYDPNPVGFKMPSPDAFTGFTQDGSNKGLYSPGWNVESSTINNGYKFYTQGWKIGPTDFWRANGLLDSGSLVSVGKYGCYWSAGPSSNSTGRNLEFYDTYLYPQKINNRDYGFSVRPVSE